MSDFRFVWSLMFLIIGLVGLVALVVFGDVSWRGMAFFGVMTAVSGVRLIRAIRLRNPRTLKT